MACMKKPYRSEAAAVDNMKRMNTRRGKGPTQQVAYLCFDCSEDMGPTTWHLRTERPIEGKLIRLRGPRRHRPAAKAWQDEDLEGQWAA
jgi:hypothetical protein